MSNQQGSEKPCHRRLLANECWVADAGMTEDQLSVLTIARYYFVAFADPSSQAWIRASTFARCAFGEARGALVSAAVLDAVQEIRMARRTMFRFSNPECPSCASVLRECERHLLAVIAALTRGQQSEVHAHAMLLCEGNTSEGLIGAASSLASLLPQSARSDLTRPHFVPARES